MKLEEGRSLESCMQATSVEVFRRMWSSWSWELEMPLQLNCRMAPSERGRDCTSGEGEVGGGVGGRGEEGGVKKESEEEGGGEWGGGGG